MSLRPSAQDQKEQKDKKKQRRKMVRAKKKERTKEAFAALKALKEQKAEANAVDRPADTIDVECCSVHFAACTFPKFCAHFRGFARRVAA